jgi:RND family efflux transporter MFP subunit
MIRLAQCGLEGFESEDLWRCVTCNNCVIHCPRGLRIIEVPVMDVTPWVHGYGTAQAGRTWRAVSRVKGWVVSTAPDLKSGAVIREGAEVLRIDPTEYDLALSQLQAEQAQIEAQIAELDTRSENESASLKIDEKALEVARSTLRRSRELAERNAVSRTQVEKDESAVLAQEQAIQTRRNNLNLYAAQRASYESNLAVTRARIAQAELDRSYTVITAPFDGRIGEVSIEPGQFLNVNELLFEAHGIEVTEVPVQIPIGQGRKLLPPGRQTMIGPHLDTERLREVFAIGARVWVSGDGLDVPWEGRFDRFLDSVDVKTRTFSVVIAVDQPYEKAVPGRRPPLVPGMFTRVELSGPVRPQRPVIPRAALHAGAVYLLDADNRLVRQPVRTDFAQGDFYCIADGLEGGERLVISDPAPAIEGMLVNPETDGEALERLRRAVERGADG